MPGFNTGIIPTISLPAHTGRHVLRGQTIAVGLGSILTPAVGVMEHAPYALT
jgi:hypothetical protein